MKRLLETIHLHVDALAATTAYVLVDLSDTTNYKHIETGAVHIANLHITAIPSTTGEWSIHIGTISEVDTTNGTALWFYGIRFTQILYVDAFRDYTLSGAYHPGLNCRIVSEAYERIISNDKEAGNTNWQTDEALASPVAAAGGTTGKPGAGDIVMLVTEIGGSSTLSLDIGMQYYTVA